MVSAKIIVATHKKYWMPSDSCYIPMHVGRCSGRDIGYPGDDTGDNISAKNPYYCELTGLYWSWKNLDTDYLGLAHYRRHFSAKPWWYRLTHTKKECVLTEQELEKLLTKYDVILPRRRNYVIENIRDHYLHTHYKEPLEEMERLLAECYPEYVETYGRVMRRRTACMFNMYIMRRDLSDAYCEWIFDLLKQLEPRIDISGYSPFQARVYGRLSELLFNVWIEQNVTSYKSIPVLYMEDAKWLRKGWRFLKSKMMNQLYD